MAAHLNFPLTPPRKGTPEARLSPRSWLRSESMHTRLQSKHLALSEAHRANLTLDPQVHTSDTTILTYHERVSTTLPLDRSKLEVTIPAVPILRAVAQEQENNRNLQAEKDFDDLSKFKIYRGNLVTKFVDKLGDILLAKGIIDEPERGENKPAYDKTTSLSTAEEILSKITAQDFGKKTGLGGDYRKSILKYKDDLKLRNSQVHDTEDLFARLLLTPQFKDPVIAEEWQVAHWAFLLTWVTGMESIQAMAARAVKTQRSPYG